MNSETTINPFKAPIAIKVWFTLTFISVFRLLFNIPPIAIYYFLDVFSLVSFAGFSIYYFYQLKKGLALDIWTKFSLPILLIPIISAIASYYFYDQPIIVGFLAERSKYYVLFGVAILFMLNKKWIELDFIIKTILICVSVYFSMVLLINFFVKPQELDGLNIVKRSFYKGLIYKVDQNGISLLYFIAIAKVLKERSFNWFGIAVLIVTYTIFMFKGRGITAFMAITTLLAIIQAFKARTVVLLFIGGITTLLILFFTLKNLYPEKVNKQLTHFTSAANTLMGKEAKDWSSQHRKRNTLIAWEYFKQSPMVGTGFATGKLKGFKSDRELIRMHPSDIGWMGVLYSYGIIGLVFLFFPLIWILIKLFRHLNTLTTIQFALYLFVLFSILDSSISAFAIKKYGSVFFIASLLYFVYLQQIKVNTQKIIN